MTGWAAVIRLDWAVPAGPAARRSPRWATGSNEAVEGRPRSRRRQQFLSDALSVCLCVKVRRTLLGFDEIRGYAFSVRGQNAASVRHVFPVRCMAAWQRDAKGGTLARGVSYKEPVESVVDVGEIENEACLDFERTNQQRANARQQETTALGKHQEGDNPDALLAMGYLAWPDTGGGLVAASAPVRTCAVPVIFAVVFLVPSRLSVPRRITCSESARIGGVAGNELAVKPFFASPSQQTHSQDQGGNFFSCSSLAGHLLRATR